jgi:hypothetical protein
MFKDNEARRQIQRLADSIERLENRLDNLSHIQKYYGYKVSVRDAIGKILEHLGLEIIRRPEETVLVEKETKIGASQQ